jgi:hypothetical protein
VSFLPTCAGLHPEDCECGAGAVIGQPILYIALGEDRLRDEIADLDVDLDQAAI